MRKMVREVMDKKGKRKAAAAAAATMTVAAALMAAECCLMGETAAAMSLSAVLIQFGFLIILAAAAWEDALVMKIENEFSLLILVLTIAAAAVGHDPAGGGSAASFAAALVSALAGMIACGGPLLLADILLPGSFGGGDVKLAGSGGAFLGAPLGTAGLAMSACAAGIFAAALLVTHKKGSRDRFPLGPFLSFGFAAAAVFIPR